MARSNQLKKTARDMLLSMALLVVPIVLIVTLFPHDAKKPGDAVRTVDYSMDLVQARRDAPFAVLAPVGLSAGWKATASHFDSQVYGPNGGTYVAGGVVGAPLRWELGYASPDGQYVALDQVTASADKVLAIQAPGATAVSGADGKVTVGGVEWQKYSGDSRRALVRTAPLTGTGAAAGTGTGSGSVSIMVSGSASFEELEQFAAALH